MDSPNGCKSLCLSKYGRETGAFAVRRFRRLPPVYMALMPPSIFSSAPVINPDSSDAR